MTDKLHARLQFNVSSQSFIDFTTDVDFYQDVLMCLQMRRPAFHVRSAAETHTHTHSLARIRLNFRGDVHSKMRNPNHFGVWTRRLVAKLSEYF